MFPNAEARPAREILACKLSTIPAKSSPPQPRQAVCRPALPHPAGGQQPPQTPSRPPLSSALLPAPRVGVRCLLYLEADVIPTPYSAVFPGGTAGQVFLFLAGMGDGEGASRPSPQLPAATYTRTHTQTPVLSPENLK